MRTTHSQNSGAENDDDGGENDSGGAGAGAGDGESVRVMVATGRAHRGVIGMSKASPSQKVWAGEDGR
jgi:hypothetical protein